MDPSPSAARLRQFRIAARILQTEAVTWLWPPMRRAELTTPDHPDFDPKAAYDQAMADFRGRMADRVRDLTEAELARPAPGVQILAFVNSTNQMAAIESTLDECRNHLLVTEQLKPAQIDNRPAENILRFRRRGAAATLRFLDDYAPLLKEIATRTAPARPMAVFDATYNLFAAIDLLDAVSPALLLVANDHLLSQRTLVASAHVMGVRTAYIQHAAVSQLFPRLDFDYALLDGMAAAESYAACEGNASPFSLTRREPTILLSGQKKTIPHRDPGAESIGIATNTLDDIETIEVLARVLADRGHPLVFRWHPRQDQATIDRIRALAEQIGARALLSDPAEEDVGPYLANLRALVAGDSSILLDAAVAGCTPIYRRTSDAIAEDYYGFLRSGLAARGDTVESVETAIAAGPPNPTAIRHYSATFGTQWVGREGELAAETLRRLATGSPLDDLYVAIPGPFPKCHDVATRPAESG